MVLLLIAPWQIAMPFFLLFVLVIVLIVNSSIRRKRRNRAITDMYQGKTNKEEGNTKEV
jgi:membrane protein implicated in regulation of membrane protease activity